MRPQHATLRAELASGKMSSSCGGPNSPLARSRVGKRARGTFGAGTSRWEMLLVSRSRSLCVAKEESRFAKRLLRRARSAGGRKKARALLFFLNDLSRRFLLKKHPSPRRETRRRVSDAGRGATPRDFGRDIRRLSSFVPALAVAVVVEAEDGRGPWTPRPTCAWRKAGCLAVEATRCLSLDCLAVRILRWAGATWLLSCWLGVAPGSPTNPGGRLWVPGSRGATRCRQNRVGYLVYRGRPFPTPVHKRAFVIFSSTTLRAKRNEVLKTVNSFSRFQKYPDHRSKFLRTKTFVWRRRLSFWKKWWRLKKP